MARLPVSILLLARDEGAALDRLLGELSFAAETVVVWDPSGTPETKAFADRRGARVFERALAGFGAQRRFALERCREPWVLWIDADERLDARSVRAIERTVAEGRANGYTLERRTYFLGRRIRWCGWQGERVLRLFRRESSSFDDAPVHERIRVSGAVEPLEATLEHHSYATWDACVEKLVRYARAGAERARERGRRASVLDLIVRPPLRFFRMYVLQLGVLDGAHGFVVCALAAAQVFLKYAWLWAPPPGPASGRS
jgi:hypothetical protein